jgi:hypothetical protein
MNEETTLTQIKEGLQVRLATIPGLRSYAYQPDNLNAPFAWPMLDTITYNGAMRGGLITSTFTVSVVVGRSAERSAQAALDGFLSYEGATSVRAALEADRSLGGVVQNLLVESASNISTMDGNDATYLMVDFRVVVYA